MGNFKEVIFSDRRFVNLEGTDDSGSIQAEIVYNKYGYHYDDEFFEKLDESEGYVDYFLKFTDCSRTIDFNIDGGTEKQRQNAMFKVESMIAVLSGFKKSLKKSFKVEDRIKKLKKEKKNAEKKEKELKSKEA